MSWREIEDAAAAKVAEVMSRPMPAGSDEMGYPDEFDPWDIFPTLYGSYSSEFDDMAIAVLREIKSGKKQRDDLGAEMFREMLCTANLCSYGSSPRVCFPNDAFEALLPDLIAKWEVYARMRWADDRPARRAKAPAFPLIGKPGASA